MTSTRLTSARTRPDDSIRIKLDRTAWMDDANCLGQDPSVEDAAQARRFANRFCGACPVREECLDYGIATKANSIVMGGRYFNVHGIPNLRWTDHPVDQRNEAC